MAAYDTLPGPWDLYTWYATEEHCNLFNSPNSNLKHIFSGCGTTLLHCRLSWWHGKAIVQASRDPGRQDPFNRYLGTTHTPKVDPVYQARDQNTVLQKDRMVSSMTEWIIDEGWPPAHDPAACTLAPAEVRQVEMPSNVPFVPSLLISKFQSSSMSDTPENTRDKAGKKS